MECSFPSNQKHNETQRRPTRLDERAREGEGAWGWSERSHKVARIHSAGPLPAHFGRHHPFWQRYVNGTVHAFALTSIQQV